MLLVVLLILCVSLLFVYFLCCQWKYYVLAWKYPGPLGLPFIGIAWKTLTAEKLFKTFGELKQNRKSPVTFWMGTMCFLYVDDPDSMQDILLSKDCSDKGKMWSTIVRCIGDSVLTAKYDYWTKLRRLTNPWLSQKYLSQRFELFNNYADNFVKSLEKQVGQGPFNIRELIQPVSFDIAQKLMSGEDVEYNEEERLNILTALLKVIKLVIKPWHNPWLLSDWVFKLTEDSHLQKQCKEVFDDALYKAIGKKEEFEKEKEFIFQEDEMEDFLYKGLVLENKGEINRKEMESNCYVFIVTSFETMAAHIFLTLLCLALNPECQEKLAEELISNLPEDPEFEVTFDDIKDLKYLDMVFNESLRFMPTIPMTIRVATSDITMRSGVVIPKGTQVLINIFNAHRNEEYWGKDACEFNPDHFLPENVAKRHPYAFVPFLKGIRTCIGSKYAMFMSKVFLCKIFRKYRLKTNVKLEDLVFSEEISLGVKNPALIEVIRV